MSCARRRLEQRPHHEIKADERLARSRLCREANLWVLADLVALLLLVRRERVELVDG